MGFGVQAQKARNVLQEEPFPGFRALNYPCDPVPQFRAGRVWESATAVVFWSAPPISPSIAI